MPKNAPVQSYVALKLASFPARSVTKISKSANMKKLSYCWKEHRKRDQKCREIYALKCTCPKL